MIDLAKCAQFAMDCLDPSQYGHAVTAEVRDAARRALGIAARECLQPSVPKPRPYEHEGIGTSYDQVERTELERNDK